MTTSTLGRSSPRAATSVARRIEGFDGEGIEEAKALNVLVLADGERLPWSEKSLMLIFAITGKIYR